ncbi:MAG: hypothetical protein K0Q75_2112 [Anaerospora sp.]|nr:hypothetical protein [Anaerospora sp.]
MMVALAIASILLVTVLGRPDKPRESLFLFTLDQTVTWPTTILAVYSGILESPVRLFPKATDSNFLLSFIFFPTAFVAYYWHYPRSRNHFVQIAYTLAFTGAIILVHVAVQKYTDLLLYITFSGYKAVPFFIISYFLKRIYADWYFSQLAKLRSDQQ